MNHIHHTEGSRPIKVWADFVEPTAMQQLHNLATLEFIHPHGLAVMPDVHAGKGSTIGTVIATDKAIIPAAVGVDIGCGMNAVRLSLKASDLPDNLKLIRDAIEAAVPVGFEQHDPGRTIADEPVGLWDRLCDIERKHPGVRARDALKARNQLGTLGGGNHFIELCVDDQQDVWVMLHSGSRGTGNIIGTYFIEKAKRRMEQHFIHLPDADLAYLPEDTDDFRGYMEAVQWAQDYALTNRMEMMRAVFRAVANAFPSVFRALIGQEDEAINCHHNYVEKENHFGKNVWVTRKGAIRARKGELGIIPGSMGAKSFIVRGLGNPDSYCSCSHGAGRTMSRTQAAKQFTVADMEAQTAGVECRKDASVIDEIPGAYKDIDTVMANQSDLVEVVRTLKQVLCIKG